MVIKTAKEINKMIKEVLDKLDKKQVDEFMEKLIHSRNIFVSGAGRSGLVGRAFAMRLMHLGFNVYVVGETITPPVRPGDLLIAISGSGKTSATLTTVKTAKELKTTVIAITSFKDSPIAKLADCTVLIGGREMKGMKRDYISGQLTGVHEPLTPLGGLFELSTMIFLDSVITKLMRLYEEGESDLRKRHANIE
ncbi:MAG: 6-phospho-3-hexuloisomerase [Candidatus Aenigmarchaeota archaeon]|nr:6-phospho-3-hexuloisomerase [Candidatus Aenigmarchaeota archaeon]